MYAKDCGRTAPAGEAACSTDTFLKENEICPASVDEPALTLLKLYQKCRLIDVMNRSQPDLIMEEADEYFVLSCAEGRGNLRFR